MAADADTITERPGEALAPTGVRERAMPSAARHAPALLGYGVPFALVLYLALRGGGFDAVVRTEAGLVIWGLVLLAALSGRFAPSRLPGAPLAALVLLAALVAWTGLALVWTESAERTFEELARVFTYLGVFCLAMIAQGRGGSRGTIDAVTAAIAVVGLLALLSRLQASWFPDDPLAAAQPYTQARLGYPLNHWNGLAELLAMGVPLLLAAATAPVRRSLTQALATASVPVMALAIYYTFSRTGLIALAAGLLAFIAFHPKRVAILPTLGLAAAASAALIAIATSMDALVASATTEDARAQGDAMLAIVLAVCAAAGALRVALSRAESRGFEFRLPLSRQTFLRALTAAVAIVLVVAGASGWAGDRWEQFKAPTGPAMVSGSERFSDVAGNGRYQYWESSLNAFASAPFTGIGPGTFEFWWARNGTIAGFIRNAHSLYFETLAELGLPGLLLVLGLIGTVLGTGIRRIRGADPPTRTALAGALGATSAFALAAGTDWLWELTVVPVAFLLIAAAIVCIDSARPASPGPAPDASNKRSPWRERLGPGALALVAMVAIGVSLAGNRLIRDSQEAGARADYGAALDKARDAAAIQPYAATPKIQEALALREIAQGDPAKLDPAAEAAREATEREPTNWRTWYVLYQINEARGVPETGDVYERARSLNPRSTLFPQE